jgi:hypothetical protein
MDAVALGGALDQRGRIRPDHRMAAQLPEQLVGRSPGDDRQAADVAGAHAAQRIGDACWLMVWRRPGCATAN